jgi:hypothetical protein
MEHGVYKTIGKNTEKFWSFSVAGKSPRSFFGPSEAASSIASLV